MDLSELPHINAVLNGVATVLLLTGLVAIRRGRVDLHKTCMCSAFGASALFLVSYATHYAWRASVTGGAHTPFHGTGTIRTVYFLLLISHIMLAMTVPFLAVWLIRLGWTERYELHRRVARIGFPIWLYVSLTGVMIYLMLYHFNPPAGG
ncbi:MAG: hypothetical protein CMJ18_16510 [Phycisphaeraceae bacterium]|nr:hypothetical protein [Phycisphaeraceae bacterium]